MTMSRRTFTTILAASLAATLNPRVARTGSRPAARNVVLVHGLFADGSPGPRSSHACKQQG